MLCVVAAAIYFISFKKLDKLERLILVIIILNITADTTSYIMILKGDYSHIIYNFLLPIERVITLMLYAANEHYRSKKRIHYFGVILVLVISIVGIYHHQTLSELHDLSNILSGLILATLSYLHLRSIALNNAGQSRVFFFFGLANLIYFTLMISAMSALPLAMQIDNHFASNILSINLLGYTLWSIILIIGVIWKKQKI